MPSMTVTEAGLKGASVRWGPKRRHLVSDLDPIRRERVEAFIEAERRAQEREQSETAGSDNPTASNAESLSDEHSAS